MLVLELSVLAVEHCLVILLLLTFSDSMCMSGILDESNHSRFKK
jgi:hypothetical protein